MPISNDPAGSAWSGPFADLLRLQTEFQSRLGEETIRYLRRLQGALGPASPGTVVLPRQDAEVVARTSPGGSAELALELENLQRVHSVVSPQLTPLVSEAGTTWFPAVEPGSAFRILPPGTVDRVALRLAVPAELPVGTYRGAIMLVGFREGAVPVVVHVREATAASETPAAAADPGTSAKTAAARKAGTTAKKGTTAKTAAAGKTGAVARKGPAGAGDPRGAGDPGVAPKSGAPGDAGAAGTPAPRKRASRPRGSRDARGRSS